MASNKVIFQSKESSGRTPDVTVEPVRSGFRTPRQSRQRIPSMPYRMAYPTPYSSLSSGPISASSGFTLDDLDVSLVEETASPDQLSPFASPVHGTCFDKDNHLLRTCIKRPMAEMSASSSGLTLRSSLLGLSPTGNQSQIVNCKSVPHTQSHRSVESDQLVASQKKDEQEPLSPLCSYRLRPIQQKTKNVMLRVTKSSAVILEFFKDFRGVEKVLEVMNISSDGEKVRVYHPNGDEGYILGDSPPDLTKVSETKVYHYSDLPSKYLKRYLYAARFVRLVQSKTTKITMYTTEAKCVLMENSPEADFEALFYKGGKVRQSREGTSLTRKDGTTRHLLSPGQDQGLSEEDKHLIEHTQQCHHNCKQLESLLEIQQSKDFSPFPVVLGRRPSCIPSQHSGRLYSYVSSGGKEQFLQSSNDFTGLNTTLQKHPQEGPQEPLSTASIRRFSDESQRSLTASSTKLASSSIVHRVFVPHVGWGLQLSNGLVLVQFINGSELSIQSSPMLITYTDLQGKSTSFGEKDQLPNQVCELLETLPLIMNQLQARIPVASH